MSSKRSVQFSSEYIFVIKANYKILSFNEYFN